MAQVRAPMPASRRAKQFSMFDALKGLKEALAAKERQSEPRRILAQDAIEELNHILCDLRHNDMVTVTFFCCYQGEYCQITGAVTRVDEFWEILQIGDICIDFNDIYSCSRIKKYRKYDFN